MAGIDRWLLRRHRDFRTQYLAASKSITALPPFLQDEKGLSRERCFWRWDTPEKYQTNIRAHYRMITGIDNAVARILDELRASGMDPNTVIIYTASNGYMMGDRGLGGKWNHYELALPMPFIMYDPTLPEAKQGRVVSEFGTPFLTSLRRL